MRTTTPTRPSAAHFHRRAGRYNASAAWVTDKALLARIVSAAGPAARGLVLDLAVGTGEVARAFKGRARAVIGADICPAMCRQAVKHTDLLVYAGAEELPFADAGFDLCVCRQGLQFMRLREALAEVRRVLKPGGRAVFCHLTSYGGRDDATSFLVQKLRNPARKNFFSPGDLEREARKIFGKAWTREYITRESVNNWISNGSIPASDQKKILEVYRNASPEFIRTHKVSYKDGEVFDSMRMEIVTAVRK